MHIPTLQLNNSQTIPQLGFGVFKVAPEDTVAVVTKAIELGYRHFDTAQMYGNEAEVGQAIRESGIPRSDFYVTSKLNNQHHLPEAVRDAFARSLAVMDLGPLDLFLIHWPLPTLFDGDYVSTWRTMIEFAESGQSKSVGVSNFQPEHLARLAAETELVPAVNQIEVHPFFTNEAARQASLDRGILVEAWSPIARGAVATEPVLQQLGAEFGKTPAQVTLRWHLQRGDIIFPKSAHPERMQQNLEIFDFELTGDQMQEISDLDKGEAGRMGPNPDTFAYIPD